MKIGLSSYSLYQAMQAKEMTLLDVIQWIADNGGQHVEIATSLDDLTQNPGFADQIRQKAADVGIDLSNYAVGADFVTDSEEKYEQEIRRVMQDVNVANRLGMKLLRHDVAWSSDTSIKHFNEQLERMAAACRRIADHAAPYGITTSVENHGYFVQASDRIQALIHAVDRPNFKTTLDVGNFMCADEDPVAAVRKNIPFASMVHIKDFYLRPAARNPGTGWFPTASGNHLRGAIVGHGDVDMPEVLRVIKSSGYDGYLSLEFEGMEDCRVGSKLGLENLFRMWETAGE